MSSCPAEFRALAFFFAVVYIEQASTSVQRQYGKIQISPHKRIQKTFTIETIRAAGNYYPNMLAAARHPCLSPEFCPGNQPHTFAAPPEHKL